MTTRFLGVRGEEKQNVCVACVFGCLRRTERDRGKARIKEGEEWRELADEKDSSRGEGATRTAPFDGFFRTTHTQRGRGSIFPWSFVRKNSPLRSQRSLISSFT